MFGGMFLGEAIAQQFSNFADTLRPNLPNNSNSSCPPPASRRVLSNLPLVTVTADDLLEATNKECLICLEEQKLGSLACKLQCGHLFHKDCVKEWLQKHCTCPVCRFELETDDVEYERVRRKRMESRKLRIRLDELKAKTIGQVKDLCRTLGVNINNCIDKSELIDRLVHSGKINITEGVPVMKMCKRDFITKNVSELRHLLLSFGLSCEGALEKSELRKKLLDSGRIVLTDPEDPSDTNKNTDMNLKASSNPSPHESIFREPMEMDVEAGNSFTIAQLREKKTSELCKLCEKFGVSINGCIDKEEIIERISSSNKFRIRPPPAHFGQPPSLDHSEYDFIEDYPSHSSSSTSSKSPTTSSDTNGGEELILSKETLADMSIKELKSIMNSFGINADNCLYRSDIMERLKNCNRIRIVH